MKWIGGDELRDLIRQTRDFEALDHVDGDLGKARPGETTETAQFLLEDDPLSVWVTSNGSGRSRTSTDLGIMIVARHRASLLVEQRVEPESKPVRLVLKEDLQQALAHLVVIASSRYRVCGSAASVKAQRKPARAFGLTRQTG